MWEIMGIKEGQPTYLTAQSVGSKLASADYHGAELTVVRSSCAGLVGIEGIVVKDTKFTFQLITSKNVLKTIPKKHTIFRFGLPRPSPEEPKAGEKEDAIEPVATPPDVVFELHGSQFEHRPTDRATKKMKQRVFKDI